MAFLSVSRSHVAAAAVVLSFGNAQAFAQQTRPQLSIIVETLDQDATNCGITKDSIESIARLTLRNNGVATASAQTNPWLYIAPTVLANCAFHMQVSVQGMAPLDLAAGTTSLGGFKSKMRLTTLCSQNSVSSATRSGAPAQFLNMLETNLKLCLGSLEY
jgi:hypothetical protein